MSGGGDYQFALEILTFCVVTDVASSCLTNPPAGCVPSSNTYYIKAEGERGSGFLSDVDGDNVVYINPSTLATKFFVFDDPGGLRLRDVDSNDMVTSVLNPTFAPNKVTLEPATNLVAQTFEIVR
jgi:hypothetical protein